MLPIYNIEQAFLNGLNSHNRFIIQAPTGSGKSTQIPRFVLKSGLLDDDCEAVILQPRRLAARMLAKRVADEEHSRLGDTVGYHIRFDRQLSRDTRLRFVTEGVLLRQMLSDPELREVKAIIFDEFHERHLEGDLSLALAKQLQANFRPDLKIIVMSATLETSLLQDYLPDAQVLTTEGRTYPVEVSQQPLGTGNQRPVWEATHEAFRKWVRENEQGDILIFMPGGYEIRQTVALLQHEGLARDWVILPLYGDLPPDQQDAAVAQYHQRKVVVATNVAETSLTIDGIRCVIDSGLARKARFDPHRGINTLLIEKISRASADQRAGRAGRTAPGDCIRLWSQVDHEARDAFELPEIKRLDLSETLLMLKASGIDDFDTFDWVEKPEPLSRQRAEELLHDLGATDRHGRITETGKRMVGFPAHPRYARMLLEAGNFGCVASTCLAVALAQGKSLLMPTRDKSVDKQREKLWGDEEHSDTVAEMIAFHYAASQNFRTEACRPFAIHAQSARQADRVYRQLLSLCKAQGLGTEDRTEDPTALRKCLLLGFSDHLAKRLDRGTLRCQLVHGRRGELKRGSLVRDHELIVATEISEIQARGDVTTLLSQATAIEESWLKECFPEDFKEQAQVQFNEDTRRVEAVEAITFRDIVLHSKSTDQVPEGLAASLLAEKVMDGTLKLKKWNKDVETWIHRVNFLARAMPELEIAPITDEDKPIILEQLCLGALGYRDIKDRDPWPFLKDWLSPEQLPLIDLYLPEKYQLNERRRCKIKYPEQGKPVIAAKIQDLYDIKGNPSLCDGRIPLKIEILAPNMRPVQITDNLEGFWTGAYPAIRKELAGRYPKHEWR